MAGSIKSILNGVVVIERVVAPHVFESFILFANSRGYENTGQIDASTGLTVDAPFSSSNWRRNRCNISNTLKLIGIIQTTALVLLLGIGFPADARQDKPDKQEEKAKPGKPEKQAKPEPQKQDKPTKPEQQQAAKGQQDQQRQQRDNSAKQQRQDNSAKQHEQAREQQDQQPQRDNS
jgi:hypothetical protein